MKRLSALVVMALAVFVAPVTAQNNELEAAKKRIHSLTNQAEKLMVEGRHEQARKLLSDASALTKRLAAASNRNREDRGENERDRRHMRMDVRLWLLADIQRPSDLRLLCL